MTSTPLVILLIFIILQAAFGKVDNKNSPAVSSLISLSSNNDIRISDNPTLVVNERQPVTLVCQFSTAAGAKLREVVWFREFRNGASVKLLTYDAVNELAQKNVRSHDATSIEIIKSSPADDGWYQCHVGVYINQNIVEKVGFVYLNVLVPPSDISIYVHDIMQGNNLFKHNFSLVCRVKQSKPAATIIFTRNGVEIPETRHVNSTMIIDEMVDTYADLLTSKDISDNVLISLTRGALQVPASNNTTSQSFTYTTIHVKGRISGGKLWESASFLLWELHPKSDVNAEYGCIARHESLPSEQKTQKILRPPRSEWLVIDVQPNNPFIGSNVILQVRSEPMNNFFPMPVLLWTNDIDSVSKGRKFYVGNKLLLRNVRRNNTVYKVQAFNALGTASSRRILTLRRRDDSTNKYPDFLHNDVDCLSTSTLQESWITILSLFSLYQCLN